MRPVYGQRAATMPLTQPFPPIAAYQMVIVPCNGIFRVLYALGLFSSGESCAASSTAILGGPAIKHYHQYYYASSGKPRFKALATHRSP